MWDQMREWLGAGMIPPNDDDLADDLAGPGYHRNSKDQLVLESKESMHKRNVQSPDDADALALTWAGKVSYTEDIWKKLIPEPRGTWQL